MSGKTKLGWGGARPGAGRKPKPVSVRQVNVMRRKSQDWAKETGYDVDDFLLAVIGGYTKLLGVDNIPLKDRITCAKIWKEYTMGKVSEEKITTEKVRGPVIGLPPITREDPAKLIPIEGGSKDSHNDR